LSKELILICGPNGSGKTTFAKSFLESEKFMFLNADEITKELKLEDKKGKNYTTGREYFLKLESLLKDNKSIIIESTLSGVSLSKHVRSIKKKGYSVKIIFVMLNNPYQCIERIKHRVKSGGHHVPDVDVVRRFERGINNFWSIYKVLAEDWKLYNNSETGFELVATGEKSNYVIFNPAMFESFEKKLKK
jgi:predicted ABC-type ATPase